MILPFIPKRSCCKIFPLSSLFPLLAIISFVVQANNVDRCNKKPDECKSIHCEPPPSFYFCELCTEPNHNLDKALGPLKDCCEQWCCRDENKNKVLFVGVSDKKQKHLDAKGLSSPQQTEIGNRQDDSSSTTSNGVCSGVSCPIHIPPTMACRIDQDGLDNNMQKLHVNNTKCCPPMLCHTKENTKIKNLRHMTGFFPVEPKEIRDEKGISEGSRKCPKIKCISKPKVDILHDADCEEVHIPIERLSRRDMETLNEFHECCPNMWQCTKENGAIFIVYGVAGNSFTYRSTVMIEPELKDDVASKSKECEDVSCPKIATDSCTVVSQPSKEIMKFAKNKINCCPTYNCSDRNGWNRIGFSTQEGNLPEEVNHSEESLDCDDFACGSRPKINKASCTPVHRRTTVASTIGKLKECCPTWECVYTNSLIYHYFQISGKKFSFKEIQRSVHDANHTIVYVDESNSSSITEAPAPLDINDNSLENTKKRSKMMGRSFASDFVSTQVEASEVVEGSTTEKSPLPPVTKEATSTLANVVIITEPESKVTTAQPTEAPVTEEVKLLSTTKKTTITTTVPTTAATKSIKIASTTKKTEERVTIPTAMVTEGMKIISTTEESETILKETTQRPQTNIIDQNELITSNKKKEDSFAHNDTAEGGWEAFKNAMAQTTNINEKATREMDLIERTHQKLHHNSIDSRKSSGSTGILNNQGDKCIPEQMCPDVKFKGVCNQENSTESENFQPKEKQKSCCPLTHCVDEKGLHRTYYIIQSGTIPTQKSEIEKEKGTPTGSLKCPNIKCSNQSKILSDESCKKSMEANPRVGKMKPFLECCGTLKCSREDESYSVEMNIIGEKFRYYEIAFYNIRKWKNTSTSSLVTVTDEKSFGSNGATTVNPLKDFSTTIPTPVKKAINTLTNTTADNLKSNKQESEDDEQDQKQSLAIVKPVTTKPTDENLDETDIQDKAEEKPSPFATLTQQKSDYDDDQQNMASGKSAAVTPSKKPKPHHESNEHNPKPVSNSLVENYKDDQQNIATGKTANSKIEPQKSDQKHNDDPQNKENASPAPVSKSEFESKPELVPKPENSSKKDDSDEKNDGKRTSKKSKKSRKRKDSSSEEDDDEGKDILKIKDPRKKKRKSKKKSLGDDTFTSSRSGDTGLLNKVSSFVG